jgi:hypothetical protein
MQTRALYSAAPLSKVEGANGEQLPDVWHGLSSLEKYIQGEVFKSRNLLDRGFFACLEATQGMNWIALEIRRSLPANPFPSSHRPDALCGIFDPWLCILHANTNVRLAQPILHAVIPFLRDAWPRPDSHNSTSHMHAQDSF